MSFHPDFRSATALRHRFLRELWAGLRVVYPILLGILAVMALAGLVVGWLEGWNAGDALYFAFVSGLTIGYGDFAPTHGGAKLLAVLIGVLGVLLTALLGAVAVQALSRAQPPAR